MCAVLMLHDRVANDRVINTNVLCVCVDMIEQGRELADRPHIVVATPGRLADHISSTNFSLSRIRFLVG